MSPTRLYYLFNGTIKVAFINEKSVFKLLIWFSPLLSGIYSTFRIMENLVRYGLGSPPLFYYSYCGKTPFPTNLINESKVYLVHGMICIVCLVSEIFCHITILVKQTKIESRANIYVLKDNKVVSTKRHHRNIVSAVGHLASFFISMAQVSFLIYAFYFSFEDEGIVAMTRLLTLFFVPATEFFMYPLIETIFSETLRGTLPLLNLC